MSATTTRSRAAGREQTPVSDLRAELSSIGRRDLTRFFRKSGYYAEFGNGVVIFAKDIDPFATQLVAAEAAVVAAAKGNMANTAADMLGLAKLIVAKNAAAAAAAELPRKRRPSRPSPKVSVSVARPKAGGAAPAEPAEPAQAGALQYMAQPGESVAAISRKFGCNPAALRDIVRSDAKAQSKGRKKFMKKSERALERINLHDKFTTETLLRLPVGTKDPDGLATAVELPAPAPAAEPPAAKRRNRKRTPVKKKSTEADDVSSSVSGDGDGDVYDGTGGGGTGSSGQAARFASIAIEAAGSAAAIAFRSAANEQEDTRATFLASGGDIGLSITGPSSSSSSASLASLPFGSYGSAPLPVRGDFVVVVSDNKKTMYAVSGTEGGELFYDKQYSISPDALGPLAVLDDAPAGRIALPRHFYFVAAVDDSLAVSDGLPLAAEVVVRIQSPPGVQTQTVPSWYSRVYGSNSSRVVRSVLTLTHATQEELMVNKWKSGKAEWEDKELVIRMGPEDQATVARMFAHSGSSPVPWFVGSTSELSTLVKHTAMPQGASGKTFGVGQFAGGTKGLDVFKIFLVTEEAIEFADKMLGPGWRRGTNKKHKVLAFMRPIHITFIPQMGLVKMKGSVSVADLRYKVPSPATGAAAGAAVVAPPAAALAPAQPAAPPLPAQAPTAAPPQPPQPVVVASVTAACGVSMA